MNNPLLDIDFLTKLDTQRDRETFAKVIALTFDESPVEEITGKITQGSISVDGTSAVRRTCSLTMVADTVNIKDYYWGVSTKIKVYIGLKNTTDSKYEDIIWFPQGLYLITSFKTSASTSGYTISLTAKDKMCLLNGDVGGSINALSYDFGTIDEVDSDGIITNTKLPISHIIREAVHEYAREPYSNILINDLDDYGLELMEYRGDVPMYFIINTETDEVRNFSFDGSLSYYYYQDDGSKTTTTLEDVPVYNSLVTLNALTEEPTRVFTAEDPSTEYTIAKIELGDTCGYRTTDLVYGGDLIGSVGDSITTILDKIVSMLGEFEYFYDLDGRFVFLKKKTYINTSWNNIINNLDEEYIENSAYSSAYTYSFENNNLITAYQNTPNLLNLRNDFSIWGKRDDDIPIHLRYAIDHKPTTYATIEVDLTSVDWYNEKYSANANAQASIYYTTETLTDDEKKVLYKKHSFVKDNQDWRELIYRMSVDYLKWNHLDDFCVRIMAANGTTYPNGITGYELYYTDMNSFWRLLYDPEVKSLTEPDDSAYFYTWDGEKYKSHLATNITLTKEYVNQTYYEYNINSGQYTELSSFTSYNPKRTYYIYNVAEKAYKKYNTLEFVDKEETYYNANVFNLNTHWTFDLDSPENLNFWFDFLDTTGEIDLFSAPAVGSRPKATNDDDVTSIYFKNTPKVVFIENSLADNHIVKKGYTYVIMPEYLENFFYISALGKSANDVLDELLYNYSYCVDNISITSIPVYHLQPNTRIYVENNDSNITGEYIITKFTIPLAYNGTMSITATKSAERLN